MDLVQTIKAARPVLYWRGAPNASGVIRDLSGKGNHSTSVTGTVRRVSAPLPGDLVTGWAADTTDASVLLGGAITGFNATAGTILTFVDIRNFALTGTRGLFDTAPAAAGAMRMYTVDDFTNMRYEIGGEATKSYAVPAKHQLNSRIRMLALHWRGSGDPNTFVTHDSNFAAGHLRAVGPATTNLAWGAVNSASVGGGTVFHSIAVFPRMLNVTEMKVILRAAYSPVRRPGDQFLVTPGSPGGGIVRPVPGSYYYA